VLGLVAAGILAASAPSVTTPAPATGSGDLRASIVTQSGHLALRTTSGDVPMTSGVLTSVGPITAETYTITEPVAGGGQTTLPVAKAAALNNGRMPLGVLATRGTVKAKLTTTRVATVVVEPKTQRVLSLSWQETKKAELVGTSGQLIAVAKPMASATTAMSQSDTEAARLAATTDLKTLADRSDRLSIAWLVGLLGAAAVIGLGLSLVRLRAPSRVTKPTPSLIKT